MQEQLGALLLTQQQVGKGVWRIAAAAGGSRKPVSSRRGLQGIVVCVLWADDVSLMVCK